MPGKVRVHELAKEYGVDSRQVLSILKELGELAKSASSTIEASTAKRVRRVILGEDPGPAPTRNSTPNGRPRVPTPPPRPAFQRKRREWYRGDPPSDFTQRILDEYVVLHADPEKRPKGARYFADEVKRARELTDEWAPALLEGLSVDDVLTWMSSDVVVRGEDAPALQRAGVRPHEIGWSYADRGEATLGERLFFRRWTVEQVINEVQARRQNR